MPAVGLIILAAGSSSRMGTPKQLLPFEGGTLLGNVVLAALDCSCRPIIVVLGANSSEIRDKLDTSDIVVTVNDDWSSGMASSIKTGVQELQQRCPAAQAAVIAACDQPFVSASLFDNLLELYLSSDKQVVASSYADTLGVPALFDLTLFPELLSLSGDKGAKSIIVNHRGETGSVDFPLGAIDLDRLDDYKALAAAGRTPDAPI